MAKHFLELKDLPIAPIEKPLRVLVLADDRQQQHAVSDHISAIIDGSQHQMNLVNPIYDSPSDLDQLEQLTTDRRQKILYLSSQSTSMRSPIASWVLYDSTQPHTPQRPSQDPPYTSVLEAVADGWHIVQFPISKLYEYRELENDYIGYEFILEKWI